MKDSFETTYDDKCSEKLEHLALVSLRKMNGIHMLTLCIRKGAIPDVYMYTLALLTLALHQVVLSGLQMREEKYNEQLKQVQQAQAIQQSILYHEQLLRSQLPSTPLGAPPRFATPSGRINPTPLQVSQQIKC